MNWWRRIFGRKPPPTLPFGERVCGCGHLAKDHWSGGWGDCKKCPCTDGMY